MVRARKRGEKLAKNYVKIAILLFIGDEKKSGSDIKDFLKQIHGITEPKGIRVHLAKLCESEYLEEEFEPGIAKYYQWKKSIKSFKKIIELISENADIVKDIILKKLNFIKPKSITQGIQIKKLLETKDFDPTKYWYNTKYAKNFLNEEILNNLLETAYKEYSKNMRTYPLEQSVFRTIVLENIDTKSILTLMHYSPNLVKYLIDLPINYKQKTRNLKEKENRIFFQVLDDRIHGNYSGHVKGLHFIPEPKIIKIDRKDFKGVRLEFACDFASPQHPVLLGKKEV